MCSFSCGFGTSFGCSSVICAGEIQFGGLSSRSGQGLWTQLSLITTSGLLFFSGKTHGID